MKKSIKIFGIIAFIAIIGFLSTGCETDGGGGSSSGFTAVTSITGVPTTGEVGILILTGTINPGNATNKNIVWTVVSQGGTGAAIDGSTLITTAAGTVAVRATVTDGQSAGTDYSQDFAVVISGGFIPVTFITGVPTAGTTGALTLAGTVNPSSATNKLIVWSVADAGTTGASISGNTLTTTAEGTVTVSATIADGLAAGTDYTQNFDIVISGSFVPVTSITDVPTTGPVGHLTLSGTVNPAGATNKTIEWSVINAGATAATVNGSTLTTTAAGTVTLMAKIANGLAGGTDYTQNFDIIISGDLIPVTSITDVPLNGTVGILVLSGTVNQNDASNKNIVWSVIDGGTTGAVIVGNTLLVTTAAGTVKVMATIANGLAYGSAYTQSFDISISESSSALSVTFSGFNDETINLTMNTNNDLREGDVLTVSVIGAYDRYYDWFLDGNPNGGGDYYNSREVHIDEYMYIGFHTLMVVVTKGGVPYSKEVTFRVVR
ncbi:MAG: hypothetical protein FWG99_05435 [Treponema sp.]|nr:hypothetical protein [Treponema sp.]